MTGASSATQRVTHLNANWTPASSGAGAFELLVVTEDEERHTVPTTAADLTALASVLRDGVVLLWDPDGPVLVIGNLLGEWIPLDWSSTSSPAGGLAEARSARSAHGRRWRDDTA